jgi:hypothetical protein
LPANSHCAGPRTLKYSKISHFLEAGIVQFGMKKARKGAFFAPKLQNDAI